jgi:AcrR family transcriptional regulator
MTKRAQLVKGEVCVPASKARVKLDSSSGVEHSATSDPIHGETVPLDVLVEVDRCRPSSGMPGFEQEPVVFDHVGAITSPHRGLGARAETRVACAVQNSTTPGIGGPCSARAGIEVGNLAHGPAKSIGAAATVDGTMATSDTQEQILDAVQSVIVRDGVRGASMRQVAQEADVSLGLLSYHFDGKESLILAAFERASTNLLEASVDAAAEVSGADDKVAAFLRGAFVAEFLDSDYLRVRVSLWAVSLTDIELAKIDASFYGDYAATLRQLISLARPTLDVRQVAARSTDVIALSNGLWLDWARYQSAEDLERGLLRCESIALAQA